MRHFGFVGIIAALILAWSSHSAYAQTDLTWDGGGAGIHWSDALNWNPDNVPDTGGPTGENAIVGNTTVNRTINVDLLDLPGPLNNVRDLQWNQSSAAVNELEFTNNFTVDFFRLTVNNTSGSPDNMLVDLNGKTFQSNMLAFFGTNNISIQTSAPGGVFQVQSLTAGAFTGPVSLKVGAGVTVQTTLNGQSHNILDSSSWDPASTLAFTHPFTPSANMNMYGLGVGNLMIGNGVNPVTLTWNPIDFFGGHQKIKGDFTINTGSTLAFGSTQSFAASNNILWVAGDFTDTNTVGDYGTGPGTIVFYGNPSPASTVLINRTGLTKNFRVGVASSDGDSFIATSTGNVKLAADLATTGTFTVRGGSSINLVDNTLTTGRFTADSGAIFSYAIGSDPGLITVNGDLNLNSFTLNVVNAFGWNDGDNLILMTYSGVLSGSPMLTLGQVPVIFEYDDFVAADGFVMLTNVVLPEPTAAGALMAGALLFCRRRRHPRR